MQIKIFLWVIPDRQVVLEAFIVLKNEKIQRIPVLVGTPSTLAGLRGLGLNLKKRDVIKEKLNLYGGSDPSDHDTCEIPS